MLVRLHQWHQDGLEDYIDCGGPNCEPCAAEITWNSYGIQYFGDAAASAEIVGTNLKSRNQPDGRKLAL